MSYKACRRQSYYTDLTPPLAGTAAKPKLHPLAAWLGCKPMHPLTAAHAAAYYEILTLTLRANPLLPATC